MTQSIAPKKVQRTITFNDTFLRRLESRAILHGNTLGEEIIGSMNTFWDMIHDPDVQYDPSQIIRQHVLRTLIRLHPELHPTAADLHNYLKKIDVTAIKATLNELAQTGHIVAIRSSHATRYKLNK